MKLTNKLKKETGITLIALVITIVVMLILAGVTINLTLGENGIFTTAQQAAKNYTDAQNKEMVGIEDFTNTVDKTINSLKNNYELLGTVLNTENNINYTADGDGNIIPVPVGFSPITTSDQGTKDTGFVIKNDTDGNEFVWVPVGSIENYKRIAWARDGWAKSQEVDEEDATKIKRIDDDTTYFSETMPENEKISIEAYGGFYIGRYETGIKNGELTSEKNTDKVNSWTGYTGGTLVVQAKQQVWNYITRDYAITESEKLYNKNLNNITSKLCSSYAWDSALKFIEKNNNIYPTNSTGGNYNIASGGKGTLQDSGYYKINNIYDLGGNAWEWTTEKSSDYAESCITRGGGYESSALDNPVATRSTLSRHTANADITFRVTLFM